MDLHEECGRKALLSTLRSSLMIDGMPEDVLDEAVQTLAIVHASESDYVRTIVEIVSDCDDRATGRGLTDPTINEDEAEDGDNGFDADEVRTTPRVGLG